MTELNQPIKRPGIAFAGVVTPFALCAIAALVSRHLGSAVGLFGETTMTFILGAFVSGLALKVAKPRTAWSSFGTGLIIASALGTALLIGTIVLIVIALSHMSS